MQLKCAVQQYAWGRRGRSGAVARLAAGGSHLDTIDAQLPYAELWIGTHPNGPSVTVDQSAAAVSLADYIAERPHCLGDPVRHRFGDQLPFLFKVLSVETALSIQVHPTKSRAEELHRLRPDVYKDANHKPEMAIALTVFEALCGFRPLYEIKQLLTAVVELRQLVGAAAADQLMAADGDDSCAEQLRAVFGALMTADQQCVREALDSFTARLAADCGGGECALTAAVVELFGRLHRQYPGDVGCFGALFLNHIALQPGEALFLAPNLPHAYLSGDCVECMACSDNVVRAGLTGKQRDVATLLDLLQYHCQPPDQLLLAPIKQLQLSEQQLSQELLYAPPVADFAVTRIQCTQGAGFVHRITPKPSASVMLCVEGTGACQLSAATTSYPLSVGTVLFVAANQRVDLTADSQSELVLFQAFCPAD